MAIIAKLYDRGNFWFLFTKFKKLLKLLTWTLEHVVFCMKKIFKFHSPNQSVI